jgi:hypothetical protein
LYLFVEKVGGVGDIASNALSRDNEDFSTTKEENARYISPPLIAPTNCANMQS